MSVLIRDMKKPEKCGVCPMRGYSLCPLTKKEVLWNLLDDDCPLIEVPEDVQPVKHGRWSGYFCSNCGISKYNFISFNFDDKNGYARPFGTWNYCPRCGAKMDGGA